MGTPEGILGAEKLTAVFGGWPSFHDAEVLALRLDRRTASQGGPTVELEIRADAMGDPAQARSGHGIAVLRFQGVVDLELGGFNEQNALFELTLTNLKEQSADGIQFQIDLVPSYGLGGTFRCRQVEVVSAVPCP